jgi:hypothetical protein
MKGELTGGEFMASETAVGMATLLLATLSTGSAAVFAFLSGILALRGAIRNDRAGDSRAPD